MDTPIPSTTSAPEPLTYQETPEITPIPEPPDQPKKKSFSFGGFLKNLVFFIILFVIGFAVSGYVRNFLNTTPKTPSSLSAVKPTPTTAVYDNTKVATSTSGFTTLPMTMPTTKQGVVLNGLTRKPIDGISFTLPTSVLPLICDGSACGSQGTYLPGGSRLTVAMRGSGQVLADYRGKIISDAGGKTFTTKQTTIGGNNAVEFTTGQIGSTIGGYSFSQMHGYMIDITDTTSLEINHFSPSGIATEWTSDETIFNTIVQSLVFATGAKGSVVYPMTTVVPVASATPAVIAPIQ